MVDPFLLLAEMIVRNLKNGLAALLPACCIALVFTLTPVDSTYTFGIIGADPVCAQEDDPVARCSDAWEFITAMHDLVCPAGTSANCQVACNSDGDVVQSSCMCFQ